MSAAQIGGLYLVDQVLVAVQDHAELTETPEDAMS
jgi:hypothetical protein